MTSAGKSSKSSSSSSAKATHPVEPVRTPQHSATAHADAHQEESRLDDAVEQTFPASDPVAETPAKAPSVKALESEDALLDEAIELSFPASDPPAAGNITKVAIKNGEVTETAPPPSEH